MLLTDQTSLLRFYATAIDSGTRAANAATTSAAAAVCAHAVLTAWYLDTYAMPACNGIS